MYVEIVKVNECVKNGVEQILVLFKEAMVVCLIDEIIESN